MVFPHVMHAQRVDHITSRGCGHIWVTCLLRFCVQLSYTYCFLQYRYDLQRYFRGLTKVSDDCATTCFFSMIMSDTSEPPNTSH